MFSFFFVHSIFSESPEDFTSLPSSLLSFDECDTRACISITIVDDLMVEMTESFNVTLSRTATLDSRITLNPSQVDGVVEIIDTDGKTMCMHLYSASK